MQKMSKKETKTYSWHDEMCSKHSWNELDENQAGQD